jgi:uncharacterized protein YfbU (UPF0304 family)
LFDDFQFPEHGVALYVSGVSGLPKLATLRLMMQVWRACQREVHAMVRLILGLYGA